MKNLNLLIIVLSLCTFPLTDINAQCDCSSKMEKDVLDKYGVVKYIFDKHENNWFALIKDDAVRDNEQKQISVLRDLLVEYLACSVSGAVHSKELAARKSAGLVDEIECVRSSSAGTVGFDSDIDVNLKGSGTEHAVGLINEKFKEVFKVSKETGEMFDINFYAKDFVPGVIIKEQQDSTKVILRGRWNKEYPKFHYSEFENEDIQFQTAMSFAFMRKVMQKADYDNYMKQNTTSWLKNEKGIISVANIEYHNLIEEQGNHHNMAKENRAYETLLKEAAQKRILFEQKKNDKSLSENQLEYEKDRAYLDWKIAKTRSTLLANEAYCTAGAIVHVVSNKQVLAGQFKPADSREHYKKMQLTAHEYYHSFNEQIAFTFHKIDETKDYKELIKVGKYMHRAYNALKHLCEESGISSDQFYNEPGRKAATDWEGLKKGKKRVEGGFEDLTTGDDKMSILDTILRTLDNSPNTNEIKINRKNIDKTKTDLKKYLINLKIKVDNAYFKTYSIVY